MTDKDNIERHPADSDGIRVVGDADAQFECSECGEYVHRFSVKYHGDSQYCPGCWNEVEPHLKKKDCSRCGDEFKKNPYDSNLVKTYESERYRKPNLCDECSVTVFGKK